MMYDLCMLFLHGISQYADFIKTNGLAASIKCFIRSARVCMLCTRLHLRDDLKLQCSVYISVMLLSA